jgi:hypothetical protein
MAPDGNGANVSAATFATQVFVTTLIWNSNDVLQDLEDAYGGDDGNLSLYELADAGIISDSTEPLSPGETQTITYGFTLNSGASDEYQGDGVIMSLTGTLTSN